MRRTLTTAAIIASLGVIGAADAQVSNQLNASPNNITIRGGIALPADSSLSNVSSTFNNIGLSELSLVQTSLLNSAVTLPTEQKACAVTQSRSTSAIASNFEA